MNRKQFLQQVTTFIHSKPAQQHVEKELNGHIQHAKKAWMDKGYEEAQAEALAIEHMGNPMTLGQELGKVHKPKVDWLIIGLVAMLLACSFLPLIAVAPYSLFGEGMLLWRHAIYTCLAVIIIVCFMLFDVRKLMTMNFIFYVIAILFALLLYSTHMIQGTRFFFIGSWKVSVWHTLPLLCIAWAILFSNSKVKLWKALLFVSISFIVIGITGNIASLLVFSVMSLIMLLNGHFEKKQKIAMIIGVFTAIIAFIAWIVVSIWNGGIRLYQLERVLGFLKPEEYADGSGWIYLRVNEVIANAKWFGAGGAEGTFIESSTDFAFLQLLKYYGYFIGIIVAILLLVLIMRMWKLSVNQPHSFAKLLVVGASTLFATQALYALAMSAGLAPIMSIPMPFMTYGLTPTVTNAFLIGLVLSVYRRKSYIFSA